MINLKHDRLLIEEVTADPAGASELVHKVLELLLGYVLRLCEPLNGATARL
ncbi:hypothetical protein ACFY2M_13625 [Streptomyces sp. NPDC001276]|uniref:hypothetical protein n=1 Tax=Streptomyces sp. NPDC001276 TaxID=3364555 RepID=UPI003689B220